MPAVVVTAPPGDTAAGTDPRAGLAIPPQGEIHQSNIEEPQDDRMTNSNPADGAPIPSRYACIDCGTNSVKLVVADLALEHAQPIHQNSSITRIGEGMRANGMRMLEEPMRRTLEVIATFVEEARAHGAVETALIGTAALRDAVNRDDFVKRVRERCGLDLEVIAGEEEARLSFLAVRRDPHWRALPSLLVIDIGGGSTELIQGAEGTDAVKSRISVNLGAVKLTEACLHSDPPSTAETASANEAARAAFQAASLVHAADGEYHVVGVGGTLTNLGGMKLHASVDPEQLHGMALTMSDLRAFCSQLGGLTVEERRALPGLDPGRADIILAGAILLTQALTHIGSEKIDVSTRGLRWGLLYDRFLP
jgi:exopolyphosphatase/guanosine-5'-triphosphate,3'-diphosphate pyrophosphatase